MGSGFMAIPGEESFKLGKAIQEGDVRLDLVRASKAGGVRNSGPSGT